MPLTRKQAFDLAVESIREQKLKEMMNAHGTGPANISTIPVSSMEIIDFLVSIGYMTYEDVQREYNAYTKSTTVSNQTPVSQGIAFDRPRAKVPSLVGKIPGTRKNRKNRKNSRKNRKNSRKINRKN